MKLNKKKMFLIIALMTLFHWIMAFSWYSFNAVTIENGYTSDYKEYIKCQYPRSKNLRL